MIQDALAIFSTQQSIGFTSHAHTDIIDTRGDGQAYVGSFLYFRVHNEFFEIGEPRLSIQLQTSDDENFNQPDDLTLVASQSFSIAQLISNAFWVVRIPPGVKRYLRVYNKIYLASGGHFFLPGTYSSYILSDYDMSIDKRHLIVR